MLYVSGKRISCQNTSKRRGKICYREDCHLTLAQSWVSARYSRAPRRPGGAHVPWAQGSYPTISFLFFLKAMALILVVPPYPLLYNSFIWLCP